MKWTHAQEQVTLFFFFFFFKYRVSWSKPVIQPVADNWHFSSAEAPLKELQVTLLISCVTPRADSIPIATFEFLIFALIYYWGFWLVRLQDNFCICSHGFMWTTSCTKLECVCKKDLSKPIFCFRLCARWHSLKGKLKKENPIIEVYVLHVIDTVETKVLLLSLHILTM